MNTRLCPKCKTEKQYPEQFTAGETLYYHCIDCQNIYTRQHYRENKAQYLQRNRRRREEVKQRVLEYLRTHPCVDCGEEDIVVLDFDHVSGKKRQNVSTLLRKTTWPAVQREIAKCEVRCSNCHRRKTYGHLKKFAPVE